MSNRVLAPTVPVPVKSHVGRYVAMVTLVAATAGLLFGFDTGVISGAIIFITPAFGLTPASIGVMVSVVTLGAMFGALAGGSFAERFGRRAALITGGSLFVIGSLLSAFAGNATALVASRLVIGLAIGLASATAPMYIAEMAPAAVRGRLVSLFQLAITVGILISYICDDALAPYEAWRWMLGLGVVPAVVLVLGMLPMPESPRWLIKSGEETTAREVLSKIRDPKEVEIEESEIHQDLAHNQPAAWSELLRPSLRPPLLIGVGLAIFQQVTGINTIIYYAPLIFRQAGLSSASTALAATSGIGVVNVLSTIIAIWLVDRLGRKPLLIAGLIGMILGLGILGGAQLLGSTVSLSPRISATVTVACVGVFIVCFAFSLGPIVWLMISEIFPNRARARAAAVATAANWAANFIVTLTFPILRSLMGPSLFLLYAALGIVAIIFITRRVPETRGRTLEEIARAWRPRVAPTAA
jgi:MFS transporter, SP family, galactose:H+ symporter